MIEYRKELESCFSVVKNGREYEVRPEHEESTEYGGEFTPRADHLDPEVSTAPPGSRERIAALARYYENEDEERSPFTNDIASDLATLAQWHARKARQARYRDVLRHSENQVRSERE